jgi:hypothetical protein
LQRIQDGNCTELGKVNSGGQDFESQAAIVVRNDAYELGANVVLTGGNKSSKAYIGNTVITGNNLRGIAFKCNADVYSKLVDLSDL